MTEQERPKKKRPRYPKNKKNNPQAPAPHHTTTDSNTPKRGRRRRKRSRGGGKRISDHFAVKDFACKTPGCTSKKKVKVSLGLIGGLELLRERSQKHIHIIKGYECETHVQKSIYKNYHPTGIAAEIQIDTLSPVDVFKLAETIDEFLGIGLQLDTQTVYVDTRKENPQKWVTNDGVRTDITEHNRHQWLDEPSA
ncbi:MAG: hypothetical protein O3A77_00565 [bacterium]|nr:hypothetical protein [bacterium]